VLVTPAAWNSPACPPDRRCPSDFRQSLPATLEAVEHLVIQFRRCCTCHMQERDPFFAELLLREVLTNAVLHGCRNDPSKSVRCAVRMTAGRLIIVVSDDGAGFDWRAARDWEAASSDCSGRGMEILRTYATRVRFNNKGNTVTIVKDLTVANRKPDPQGDSQ
jgi:serine/threonine-protein kinase RsbW